MKKFRKLVPALCMLLISAVLLGTSTFAWFSMNTTVTATGMQVTAKTDHTYLLITKNSENKDIATLLKELQTTPTNANAEVKFTGSSELTPSAHKEFGATGASTAAAKTDNWYTAASNNPNDHTAADGSEKTLAQLGVELGGYVRKETVYITVTKDSTKATNLTVSAKVAKATSDSETADITPIRVLVVCGDEYVEFDSTKKVSGDVVIAAEIASSALTQVDIYIYYDGNDQKVTTNNAKNLDGATIDLTFTVTPSTAA